VNRAFRFLADLSQKTILSAIGLTCLFFYVFLASMPTDLITQTFLVVTVYAFLILVNQWREYTYGKLIYLALITLLSLRYFIWRSTETLVYEDPVSFVLMIVLYGAELFGFLLFIFGLIVNVAPLNREKKPVKPKLDTLPSVDIFIPTYNEAPELLSITVAAAKQIDYPDGKLNVYVLDDGGTEAKLSNPDLEVREEALQRQQLIFAASLALSTEHERKMNTPKPAM
jgi:cellulose synthase (UDP-forming)